MGKKCFFLSPHTPFFFFFKKVKDKEKEKDKDKEKKTKIKKKNKKKKIYNARRARQKSLLQREKFMRIEFFC